jgi:general secretion pathway protein J
MRNYNKGFTLLELIISITLIGLIVVILAGAMRVSSRSIASGEKKIEYLDRMRATINFIDSQIQSQIPLTYEEDGENKYYFKGERELLQFSTNYSIWGGEKGYVIATYWVQTNSNGKQELYVSETIVGTNFKRETKLTEEMDTIYFEYFYKDPTEEQGTWVDNWDDETSIPEKILFHFVNNNIDSAVVIPVRVIYSTEKGIVE